jgi:3-oxoadipate CoA-transferase alpha subunit
MATAAAITIVQAQEVVQPGVLDPEVIVTPGIFVHRLLEVSDPAHESLLVAAERSYP